MKRLMLIGLAISVVFIWLALMLTICLAYADQVQVPAPFAKAIELAEKSPIDPRLGIRCWVIQINEDGREIEYRINYHKDHILYPDHVVLYMRRDSEVRSIAFHLDSDRRSKYTNETGWVVISEKECIEIGFRFFRELVAKGLI